MKFHEPDWIGEVVRCGNCAVQFTLEAEDENLISCNGCDAETAEFQMACPKCNEDIEFEVVLKKNEQETTPHKHEVTLVKNKPQPEVIEAYLFEAPKRPEPENQPIDVASRPIDGELDVRAMRRRLLNNNN